MGYGNGMRGGRNEMDVERERGMYDRPQWRGARQPRESDWTDEREAWRSETDDRWSARPAGDYPSEPSWGGRSGYNTDDRWRDARWRGENQRRDDARDYDRGFSGGSVGGGYGASSGSWAQEQRSRAGDRSSYDSGARGYDRGEYEWRGAHGASGHEPQRGTWMSDRRSDWTPSNPPRAWEGAGSNLNTEPRSYRSSAYDSSFGSSPSSYGRGALGQAQPQERGAHAGRGPKGYRRNDERVREDVCECLKLAHDVDASEIEVTVSNGEVTLNGTVESRQEKRMAEEYVAGVSGVDDVDNRLKLKSRSENRDSSESTRGLSSASSMSSSMQSKPGETKGSTTSSSQSKSGAGRSTYES